jgi:phage gpG-like protein
MSGVNITIQGDLKAVKDLNTFSKEINDFRLPLTSSSEMYMSAIAGNFNDEGQTFGEKWPKLSPATIAEKRVLYAKGQSKAIVKPLVRTGQLRAGFNYNLLGMNTSAIINTQEYSQLHQMGGTSSFHGKTVRIPRRVLAKVDQSRLQNVTRIFTGWVVRLLKKSNLSVSK